MQGLADLEDICSKFISYELSFFVGNVMDIIEINDEDLVNPLPNLLLLQRRLKYGVKTETAVSVCEKIFNDRFLANLLADEIGHDSIEAISKMLGTSKSSVHTAEVYSTQTLMAKSQRCNIHLHQLRLPCSDKDEVCCTTPDLYGNDALCFLHCVRLGVLFVEQYRNFFRYLQDPIK